MTHAKNATRAIFQLEELAIQGFEQPKSLTSEEIKFLCAAVLMEEVGRRRRTQREGELEASS